MRIRRVELSGFKSFMDRTVIDLPDGVTAIVGPNGCGKSNIVDAIRWVLGEQSPKHLRGATMEDVIFAGNADQGPLVRPLVIGRHAVLRHRDSSLVRAVSDSGRCPVLLVRDASRPPP